MNIFHFYTLIFLWVPVWEQGYDWTLEKDSEGIKVYTRNVENFEIKEFKASCIIQTPSGKVLDILRNVENYPLWVEHVSFAEKIKAEDTFGFYYQLDMPWPVKDRDVAMVMEETNAEGTTILIINSEPDLVALDDEFVRMKFVKGTWEITPITSSSCEVTYQFLADPEGNLPSWVVNMFLVDGPFKTLQNLKQYGID